MTSPLFDLGVLFAVIALIGIAQMLAGYVAVQRARLFRSVAPQECPPITVLKPLCGDEPMLEKALESFCTQQYPNFQIVFGLQHYSDPAQHIVRRLQARFPEVDMTLVINPATAGANRKIGNLLNMLPYAKYDVLVMSDSDIHVAPDYLTRVADAFEQPNVGLVTSLYSGLPSSDTLAGRLGASQINQSFVPGVLMARWMGRDACLGATMAIRRNTLERIGGLAAFRHIVADDAFIGQAVQNIGLRVQLMTGLPATTVPETALGDLWQHELRWARTTRSLAPVQYGMSIVQYPLIWAMLAVLCCGISTATIQFFISIWLFRASLAAMVDHSLKTRSITPLLWAPLRDLMSALVILLSYGGDNVRWRGQVLSVSQSGMLPDEGLTP